MKAQGSITYRGEILNKYDYTEMELRSIALAVKVVMFTPHLHAACEYLGVWLFNKTSFTIQFDVLFNYLNNPKTKKNLITHCCSCFKHYII